MTIDLQLRNLAYSSIIHYIMLHSEKGKFYSWRELRDLSRSIHLIIKQSRAG